MKVKILKTAKFVCMVLVLGIQALLHGSWHEQKSESLQESRPQSR